MEITSKIINNRSPRSIKDLSQINQLESEIIFKDLEYKCKKSEYNRIYYLKHRERLIKENTEYFKNYRLKNKDKLNAYQRKKYHERKNKIKEKNEDIKKDIEKLKKK